MKYVAMFMILITIIYSCTKKEIVNNVPVVVNRLSSCDSIKQGLLNGTSDTIRLVSCLSISGCDSIRLNILKPTIQDTLRLLFCVKITGCDSLRLSILKPGKQDTLRLLSCIKITGCDSLRLGILKPNKQDSIRLLSCIKISGCDSVRLGILESSPQNLERLACNLTIGQKYQGGIVAYILQSGDPGYDPFIRHGIIASTTDLASNIRWYNGTYFITGANATTLGSGLTNTNIVILKQGGTAINYAAGLARAYNGGGFNDWYLPSRDELNKLYLNRAVIGGFKDNANCSGYNCGFYWSSSESSDYAAWAQYFVDGQQQNTHFKMASYSIRAVRSF